MVGSRVYLDESSMEKNTYSPESTIPSCSAAKRISLMVVELAHITTTETKEKKKRKPVYPFIFRETRLSANFNRRAVTSPHNRIKRYARKFTVKIR